MTRTVHTAVCTHNCPDACSMRVGVEEGRIVSIAGDPEHPFTRGFLCGKVNRYAERVYAAERVPTPLRRVGAKGEGRFAPMGWDEALDEIAQRWRDIAAQHGAEAILPYSFSGTVGCVQMNIGHRLFHALGASRLARTICSTQAVAGQTYTTGPGLASDPETLPQSKLIVLWGLNAVATHIHLLPLIKEARRNGAQLVVIDSHRNGTARQADWHLAPRPGTDAALALGLMHVLIAEGLYDGAFVDRYTLGFEDLRAACADYTPQRVAEITGLTADAVLRLARMYGTTRPAFIRMGLGPTRRRNGAMLVRTVSCLPALTGDWELPGGGFMRQGWSKSALNVGLLTQPAAEDPPARTVNMLRLGEALLETDDPPVQALYVYNSNPAAVTPDQSRVHAGLAREDLFTVVHDPMFTDTTDFADIVLPATTMLEHDDVVAGVGTLYVQRSRAAIAPLHEARSNLDVFAALAARLGLDEPVYTMGIDALADAILSDTWAPEGGHDREAYHAGRPVRQHPPPAPWRDGKLATPSGRFEFFSERLAAEGLSPVPEYTPSPEGHEANGAMAAYPLQLSTPHAHHFINSSFVNVPTSRRLERGPTLQVHPADAAARGLTDGAECRVFNGRGACLLTVEVTENVLPGVVVADSTWWPRFHADRRNINQLISAEQTDLGGGALYQDCRVEVEAAG